MSNDALRHAFGRKYPSNAYMLVVLAIADEVRDPRKMRGGDFSMSDAHRCELTDPILRRKCNGMDRRKMQRILKQIQDDGLVTIARGGPGHVRSLYTYLFKIEALAMGENIGDSEEVRRPIDRPRGGSGTASGAAQEPPLLPICSQKAHKDRDISISRKGEKPEQSRMTLLSTEPGGQERRVRAQIAEAKKRKTAG